MKRKSNITRYLRAAVTAALLGGCFGLSPAASALPVGGASSTAAIAVNGTTMNITGAENNLITWLDFSIGKGEKVAFDAHNYLNYVTGNSMSSILGTLTGSGTIYLVNPNGISIGEGASIDVGTLHLSTADLSGKLTDYTTALNALNQAANFVGDVVNKGNLTAAKEITVQGKNITFKNVTEVKAGTSLKVKATDSSAFHVGRTNSSTLTLTGDSTAPTYYKLISDAAGLRSIDNNLSGNYMLANDINLTAPANKDTGTNFTPIGGTHWNVESEKFTGKFDGLNYSINNLYQYSTPTDSGVSAGLFAAIGRSGVVENLALGTGKVTLTLSGNGYSGSFAGLNDGTLRNVVNNGVEVAGSNYLSGGITGYNCYIIDGARNNAAVTANVSYSLGGIAGENDGANSGRLGIIRNSFNTGTVNTSSSKVGGIAGNNLQGKISNVGNSGAVTGKSNVGGVAGLSSGTITNAYNTGNITGTQNSGAINVGGIVGQSNGTVANVCNSGDITGPSDAGEGVAGIVGALGTAITANQTCTVKNAYNTGKISGYGYIGGIIGNDWAGSNGERRVAIENVYNTGELSSTIIGSKAAINATTYAVVRVIAKNAFFTNDENTNGDTGRGTKVSVAAMKQAATFPGFDIDKDGTNTSAVWRIYEGKTMPLLTAFMTPLRLADTTLIYDGQAHSVANLANVDLSKIYGGSLPFYTQLGTYKYTGLQSLYSDQFGYNIIAPSDTATLTIEKGAEVIEQSETEAPLAAINQELEKIGATMAQLEAAVAVAAAPVSSEPVTEDLDTAATTATTSGDKKGGNETGTAVPAANPRDVTWTGQGVLTIKNGGVKEPKSMQGEDVAQQQKKSDREEPGQEE